MSIPQDIADRLLALDRDPEPFSDMVRSEGADFVRGFVGKLEEADSLYHEWSPKLRAFASHSRANIPVINPTTLDPRDTAKLPVYESLISKAEQLPRRHKNEVLICSIPVLGIPTALSLWPGSDDRCVFLTPEELSEWHTIYEHQEEAFRWQTIQIDNNTTPH